jgi:hypothetical protein
MLNPDIMKRLQDEQVRVSANTTHYNAYSNAYIQVYSNANMKPTYAIVSAVLTVNSISSTVVAACMLSQWYIAEHKYFIHIYKRAFAA